VAELAANEPAIDGYRSYEELRRELEAIAGEDAAELQSLGTTLGGREIFVLTLSIGDASQKPAILVVGSVHAPHVFGSELAVRLARRLVDEAKSDESFRRVLEEQTIYIIPLPSPDASEAFFHKPYSERTGNARATDDDRDGRTNEDGPEDLNGDGQITVMRIEDPTGNYLPHPADERVLIEADAKQGEQGKYLVEIEGLDNDQDESQSEDGPGGVAFDRNFTFQYPYFEAGAGPHQVSEPETRAIADFAFDHPNIYLVFSFSPHDNLNRPWKSGERSEIPTSVLADDAPYLDYIAQKYQDLAKRKDAPESPGPEGSFVHWAYFHFGRWSLATRGWWAPRVEDREDERADDDEDADRERDSKDREGTDEQDAKDDEQSESKEEQGESAKKAADEKRGADDVNALRWFAEHDIEGFAPWSEFNHPDYPDRRVEVGGFVPYMRLNPPAGEMEGLAETHSRFLVELAGLRPRLAVSVEQAEDLGGGIYRVTAEVRNDGYLPTESAMGSRAEKLQRLEMRIELPEEASLVHGVERVSLGRLVGHGGAEEHTWLIRVPEAAATKTIKIIAGSPTTGTAETTRELP
jgi:hypothetical protein